MVKEKSLIENLQDGAQIRCLDCKKDFYVSAMKPINKSLEFYCPNCDKNFRVSVRYKRYFDRVEAKKTFSDIVQKDRHRSKQKEKV